MKRKNKYHMIPVTRIILMISVTIFLCINPFLGKVYALNGADVALYNDSIAPSGYSGVWQDGITAIKNMLTTKGFTYEEITYKDLNESTQNFSNLYKVILIPGGWAPWYNYWISKAGKERIRNFIQKGGGYFGICAGAYFACDRIVSFGVLYDDNCSYNAYGELTGYDLDLFPGIGTGPINEIANWPDYKMTTINFQTENTVLKGYKQIPYTEDMLYYGGPYFTSDTGSQVEILGTYNYNGQPAIVAFNYGSGKVVLSGPHPEIGGPNWDLAKYMLNWLMKPSDGLWSIDEGNPGDNGRGFQLELRNNVMVLTYYGYNADGKAQWYLAAGNFANGSFSASMERYEGGTYLGGPYSPASLIESVGTVSVTFSSSTSGTIILPNEQPKGISKYVWSSTPTISSPPSDGLWSIDEGNPGDNGRGFQLELQDSVMVLTYYGYNADGKAQWYLAAGNFANGSFSASMERYEGGTYLGGPYSPASLNESVGTVSITFSSSTKGTIILPNEQPKGISKFLW